MLVSQCQWSLDLGNQSLDGLIRFSSNLKRLDKLLVLKLVKRISDLSDLSFALSLINFNSQFLNASLFETACRSLLLERVLVDGEEALIL